MNFTLNIINTKSKERKTPRTLQAYLATTPDGKLCAISNDIIRTVIQFPTITFMRDGILIDGFEDGETKGRYYKQRWWLQEAEVEK